MFFSFRYRKALTTSCAIGVVFLEAGPGGLEIGKKIRALMDDKVAAYRKAAELRPTDANAHYGLGVAYIEKARDSRLDEKRALLQLALEQFRLFQQLAPQDPRAPAAAHNIEALEPQVK